MLARLTSTVFVALPLLAAANTLPARGYSEQCNTGTLNCCDSVHPSSSGSVAGPLGLLGIVLGDLSELVGLRCSPLNVIGLSGTSCSAQPACCTGNTYNGLVTLGCTPINLNV